MKYNSMSLLEAYSYLREMRPICRIKQNFLTQLIKYEKQLKKDEKYSTNIITKDGNIIIYISIYILNKKR